MYACVCMCVCVRVCACVCVCTYVEVGFICSYLRFFYAYVGLCVVDDIIQIQRN